MDNDYYLGIITKEECKNHFEKIMPSEPSFIDASIKQR